MLLPTEHLNEKENRKVFPIGKYFLFQVRKKNKFSTNQLVIQFIRSILPVKRNFTVNRYCYEREPIFSDPSRTILS